MNKIIPIFPLRLVVFPQSKYPLHIFEPRYKKLIAKCLTEASGFGIVASSENKLFDVGVYVIITKVIRQYQNGDSDIIVEGTERFLINSTSLHPDGYLLAEVEKYLDNEFYIDNSLLNQLRLDFEEILELANYKLEKSFWDRLNKSEFKSFKIAEKSGMGYEQQQEMLILKSENERLFYLINYFNFIKEKVSRADSLKSIIMNDGYLND
jgi:ATP-dependent Lon protease